AVAARGGTASKPPARADGAALFLSGAPLLRGGCRRCRRRRRRALGVNGIGRRIGIAALLDNPQPRDVLEVVVVLLGEYVAAGAICDKEHFARARRIGGSLDRGAARIADWPGRQPVDHVGVVGRRLLLLALGDRMAERAFAADQTVDDGRIGFETPALL